MWLAGTSDAAASLEGSIEDFNGDCSGDDYDDDTASTGSLDSDDDYSMRSLDPAEEEEFQRFVRRNTMRRKSDNATSS